MLLFHNYNRVALTQVAHDIYTLLLVQNNIKAYTACECYIRIITYTFYQKKNTHDKNIQYTIYCLIKEKLYIFSREWVHRRPKLFWIYPTVMQNLFTDYVHQIIQLKYIYQRIITRVSLLLWPSCVTLPTPTSKPHIQSQSTTHPSLEHDKSHRYRIQHPSSTSRPHSISSARTSSPVCRCRTDRRSCCRLLPLRRRHFRLVWRQSCAEEAISHTLSFNPLYTESISMRIADCKQTTLTLDMDYVIRTFSVLNKT